MNIYEHYKDVYFRGNLYKLQKYKKLLNKKDKFLIDLLFDLEAYNIGFTMQIWALLQKRCFR